MTNYLNPKTRSGGVEQIVVPERQTVVPVDDAPFDDEQYVRVNGEWVPYEAPPIIPDTLAPKAPGGLSAVGTMAPNGTSVDYALDWAAPTQNTDNSPLTDFAYYVVRWRYGSAGPYQMATAKDSEFLLPGMKPATNIEWSVLARDTSGNDSAWADNTIVGVADSTAPNQPSLPQLGSRLGSIVTAWDGLDFSAGAMPSDFAYLEVYMSATTGGPWETIGQLNGTGVVVVAGIPVGQTRFITFKAFDTSGNASTRSGESSITVLGVTGPDIEANAITANMISAGELAAAVTITGFLLAGDPTGSRVVIDGEGVRQYSTDGDIRINLPTDPDVPAQFEGNAIMDSLTINDFLAIRGINNEISKGAVLALSSGTTAPSSAPSIAVDYGRYTSPRHQSHYLFAPTGHVGALDNDDDFYGTYSFYGYGQMNGPTGKKYNFPERTDNAGYTRATYNFDSSTAIAIGGAHRVVGVGNRTLNNGDTPAGYLSIWDPAPMNSGGTVSPTLKVGQSITTDNYVWITRLGRAFSSNNAWANRFAMGIQQSLPTPNIFALRVYSATDTAITQIGTDLVVTSPLASGEGFMGVTYGDSVKLGFPGAAQSVWLIHGKVNTYAFSATGVRIPQFDFPSPSGQAYMSAWGDLASNGFIGFRTTEWKSDSRITQLTNNHWDSTVTSSKWWVSGTWYDPDVTGSTHETAQSARASITMLKRAGLTFTVPTFPARPFPTTTDDVLAARVYLARGNTDPGRTYMERVATVTSPTRSGYIGTFAFPAGVATAPPPAASNFPATSPAKVQSADGTTWVLQGDGNGFLGKLLVVPGGATTLGGVAVDAAGNTNITGLNTLTVGSLTDVAQRLLRLYKKNNTAPNNNYESREYMFDNGAATGRAFGLYENGVAIAQWLMYPNASFEVRGQGSQAGKGDLKVEAVSVGRGAVPNGYAFLSADSAGVASTTVTDSGLDITVTVRSDRKYKLTCSGNYKSTVANDRAAAVLRDGTTNIQVGQSATLPAANSSVGFTVMKILDGPTAGTHTYKLALQRISGTGTVVAIGGAFPTEILLEDIGAAGV